MPRAAGAQLQLLRSGITGNPERADGQPYQEANRDVHALLFSNVGPLFEKRCELSVFQKVVTIHERLVASGCVALRQ